MIKKILIYVSLLFPLILHAQIATRYVREVETVLKKAGHNRRELEQTLSFFKKSRNPLKLKAARFLIAHMDGHYSMDYYWQDQSGQRIPFNELDFPNIKSAVLAFAKVKTDHPGLHPHAFKTDDITTIKANFLIENINTAFEHWQNSCNYQKISFDDFCEYVLPYRVSVEPLQVWRSDYHNQFSWITDKYRTLGLKPSLTYVSADLRSWFSNTFSLGQGREPLPRLGAQQLLFRKKGPCEDIADLVVFAMRSQGIPAAINYVPYWATSTASHFMNTVFDEKMQPISFDAIGKPAVDNVLGREPSKVLRLTYSKQAGAIAEKLDIKDIPPGFMRTSNYIDVTNQFWRIGPLHCKLFTVTNSPKYAYVCVFNGLGWRPTWWAENRGDSTTFKDMPKGVVFLPVFFANGRIRPAGYPIAKGYHHELVLEPDTVHKQAIQIKEEKGYLAFRNGKSYKLFYWNNNWKLLGSRLAGPTTRELSFKNVPKNALYLLIPDYSEKKERPFMVVNGKTLWW